KLPIPRRKEVHGGKRQDQRKNEENAQHPLAEIRDRFGEAAQPCAYRRCCRPAGGEDQGPQCQSPDKDDSDGDDPGAPTHFDIEPSGSDIGTQTNEEDSKYTNKERSYRSLAERLRQLAAFFLVPDAAHTDGISAISRHFFR